MTDLSILCLHNSTTSWESQQRGGIVEEVMRERRVSCGGSGGGGCCRCCDCVESGELIGVGSGDWWGGEAGLVEGRSFIKKRRP